MSEQRDANATKRVVWGHWVPFCALAALCAVGGGCGSVGELSVRSAINTDLRLASSFAHGVYGVDNENELHILLTDAPAPQATQAVHIRMFWRPVAGATPVDRNAINAVVRYVIFTEQGVGIYDGAGFLQPTTKLGVRDFKALLQNATLRLLDSTENFNDQLGLALVAGEFAAARNDAEALKVMRTINEKVTQRLGYQRFVKRTSGNRSAAAKGT